MKFVAEIVFGCITAIGWVGAIWFFLGASFKRGWQRLSKHPRAEVHVLNDYRRRRAS